LETLTTRVLLGERRLWNRQTSELMQEDDADSGCYESSTVNFAGSDISSHKKE